tara:strand:+ start:7366 stop:9366 length:2001 start_codon:yes stop_codon:yes gene_type:complete
MSTGFGYVERQVENQIDWSAVASGFTDTLKAEVATREAKKAELDKAAREMQEILANAPSGDFIEANEFTSAYAADGAATMLAANRALKAGLLQPRQYSLITANLQDSTTKIFGMAQKYQDAYKTKMERLNSLDPATRSQKLEQWKMEQAEGLFNIKNTKALINQNNGMVSIGHWEDGSMDGNPNKFMTVNQLTGLLNEEYDYFDLNKAIELNKSALGVVDSIRIITGGKGDLEYLRKTASQGGKFSDAAEELKLYNEWRDATVEELMINEYHITSVLTDYGLRAGNGKQFTFTEDKEEFDAQGEDGNLIFLDTSQRANGVPVFKEGQKEKVREYIKGSIDASIDKQLSTQTSRRGKDTATDIAIDRDKSSAENKFNMLSDLYYGDDAAVDAAETFFRDNIQNAIKVDKRGDVVVVTFRNNDGTTSTRDVPLVDANGNLMGFETFAQSATLLTGIDNIADSVDLGGGVQTGKVKSVIADEDEENGIVIEFENGRKEKITLGENEKLTDDKYQNLVGQTIEFRSVSQGTDGGAQVFQDETVEAQGQRYYDEKLTSNLADGTLSEEEAEPILSAILSPFGFTVDQADYLSNYRIKITKGEEEFIFETDGGADALQALIGFVKGATGAAEYAGQEQFLNKEIGKITGEDLAAQDRERRKALDTSKYNKQQ